MNHHALRLAAWPYVVVIACILLAAGCQDGSGPSLVTSPEGEPAFEGAKPPPPPPPPPADPAIAFVVPGKVRSDRGWQDVSFFKVMNADGSNVTTIFTGEPITSGPPSWSPDGHTIAFQQRYTLWLIDVTVINGVPTGTNARVILQRSTHPCQPNWSPDGTLIAFATISTRTLEVIPATGGATDVLYTSPPGVYPHFPAWSRDGTQIAFAEGQAIRMLDFATHEVSTVIEGVPVLTSGAWFLDWAHTQDTLTFEAGPGGPEGHDVFTLPLPTGTPTLVVAGGRFPAWSPNDQEIVFSPDGSGGLAKLNLATGQITGLGAGIWPDWKK